MGYNLYIGEGRLAQCEPGEELRCEVTPGQSDDAPVFPGEDYNVQVGIRWPSYSVWAEFARSVGLYPMFYDEEDGLLRPHPGVRRLSESHRLQVAAALLKYRERHPDAVPQFAVSDEDSTLARLVWLDFWIGWALKNCALPAFGNS